EAFASGGCEVGVSLDREHVRAHGGQHRRLVARARPDLEDAVAGSRGKELRHLGDHVRLADGLAGLDREGLVRIRAGGLVVADEPLARDPFHRLEDALVADPAVAQLALDHAPAILRTVVAGRVAHATHAGHRRPRHMAVSRRAGAGGPYGEADAAGLTSTE